MKIDSSPTSLLTDFTIILHIWECDACLTSLIIQVFSIHDKLLKLLSNSSPEVSIIANEGPNEILSLKLI